MVVVVSEGGDIGLVAELIGNGGGDERLGTSSLNDVVTSGGFCCCCFCCCSFCFCSRSCILYFVKESTGLLVVELVAVNVSPDTEDDVVDALSCDQEAVFCGIFVFWNPSTHLLVDSFRKF